MSRGLVAAVVLVAVVALAVPAHASEAFRLLSSDEPSWASGIYNSFCEECDHFTIDENGVVESTSPPVVRGKSEVYDALVLAQLAETELDKPENKSDAATSKKADNSTSSNDDKKKKDDENKDDNNNKGKKVMYAPTLNCDCQFIPQDKSVWVPTISPVASIDKGASAQGGKSLDDLSKKGEGGEKKKNETKTEQPSDKKKDQAKPEENADKNKGNATAGAQPEDKTKGNSTAAPGANAKFREVQPGQVEKLMTYDPEQAELGNYRQTFLQYNGRGRKR